jgi:4-amino-4-deoxy-L-arabinose transferase-like glycosyltransferase
MLIELALSFREPFSLLLFVLLAAGTAFWAYRRLKKKLPVSLNLVIVINLVLWISWARLVGIDHDESAHLHLAWMVSRGLIPFRDFWMHQSPLLWILLAPLFYIIKPSPLIFEIARLASGLIFVVCALLGWQIAKKVWGRQARLSFYLLVLSSCAIAGEFFIIRPDGLMALFLLSGIYFSLEIPNGKLAPLFWAGLSFAIAASFMFKQYLLYLLPVIAIFLGDRSGRWKRLAVYVIGFIFGVMPLVWYLIQHNITREFFFWLFKFNLTNITVSISFSLGIICIGGWGAYLLLRRYRESRDKKSLILFCAFVLSTLSSLTSFEKLIGLYYLIFWFFMCALVGSGYNIVDVFGKITSLPKRSVAIGIFVSLLITPNIVYTANHRGSFFSKDKNVVAKLMKYCAKDTCLTILPLHPVYAFDATRLYSFWQHYWLNKRKVIVNDLKDKNFAEQIISSPPALIMHTLNKKDIFLELFLLDLISSADYANLRALLKQNYAEEMIGGRKYYIRNDRLK